MAETELQSFINEKLGIKLDLLAVDGNGIGWFIGRQVTMSLGYTDLTHALKDHVYEENRKQLEITDNISETLQLPDSVKMTESNLRSLLWINPADRRAKTIINEYGLYQLAMASKAQNAEAFRKWLAVDVLPSIRKYGAYADGMEKLSDSQQEQVIAKLTEAADLVESYRRENELLKGRIEFQERIIADKDEREKWLRGRRHAVIEERDKAKASRRKYSVELGAYRDDARYQQGYIEKILEENGKMFRELHPVKVEVRNETAKPVQITVTDREGFVVQIIK